MFRRHFMFADLSLWAEFGATATMAMDDTGGSIWRSNLVRRLVWISPVPAFLQSLQRDVWIARSSNDSDDVALCVGPRLPDRRRSQCRH